MHLVPKSQLYGLPARTVRDFLRHVGLATFDEEYLRSRLQVSTAESHAVVAGLLADEYIDHAMPNDGVPAYGLIAKGRQLAMASFAPPITRSVGEQLLMGVLARAAEAASEHEFVFQITKIALFGSMLGTAPLVSDLDLALEVKPRFDGTEFDELNQQRIELAERGGKHFKSMLAAVVWPRVEVIEFLRGGSRYVSVHSFSELELLKCPYRVVYDSSQGDRGA